MKTKRFPGIAGSRDTFGIGKAFVDEKTGKTIDNYISWERAGYTDTKGIKNDDLRERVKEQKEKRKDRREKKIDNRNLPL